VILYTFCKVRGYKVIVGFFNNEPRYIEPILSAVEATLDDDGSVKEEWQVSYVLLLWLSHLLLIPFDLASISDTNDPGVWPEGINLRKSLPSLVNRALRIGLTYLPSPTKAQEAAAALMVRLLTRPDMQKLKLADAIVEQALQVITASSSEMSITVYQRLGYIRLLAGAANSADLGHLFPKMYKACEQLIDENAGAAATSDAAAKKMMVKVFRNMTVLSLRSAPAEGVLPGFLDPSRVLEDVVDYLLRSLGDRDSPVRYAAAKATSLIILELDPSMGYEVIQAILDTFKEDMPRSSNALDFRTADPLKWHGLTLALAHALFKRTASPAQLPDIVLALIMALQFEQRTATGSSIGTNVRDAANFGIWSMSRRYTTDELLAVETGSLRFNVTSSGPCSVIQAMAIQLILSACLDPAGNVRRGSSAALQELIGRHPNEVFEGIALVQIVDYQAIGLRRRALVDVANRAAVLHAMYHGALVEGLLGWRGLGAADVASRDASATSIARLHIANGGGSRVFIDVLISVDHTSATDAEAWHGTFLTLAYILEEEMKDPSVACNGIVKDATILRSLCQLMRRMPEILANFTPRILRSELPAACARLITAACDVAQSGGDKTIDIPMDCVDIVAERLLSRHEDTILSATSRMVQSLFILKRKRALPLGHISAQQLNSKVVKDGSKSTLSGAGRAVALGALVPRYGIGLQGEKAVAAVRTLSSLILAMSVDWRVVALRALDLTIVYHPHGEHLDPDILKMICDTVLQGMKDYTIDERGDVGSLVRLQAIACAPSILTKVRGHPDACSDVVEDVRAEILRLSLEKLDRVRLQAAQLRLGPSNAASDIAAVSSYTYFYDTLQPLRADEGNELDPRSCKAVLEGYISCAGVAAEPLLQTSRAALVDALSMLDGSRLHSHLTTFSAIMKIMLTDSSNMHPALELLAFLLDMQIPQRLAQTDFKWRNLLSTVQKSHHKSNDIPKIQAAVHIYRGLVDVEAVRVEVLKKLCSMLKTNPYPVVRVCVAETLWVVTKDEALKAQDWTRPSSENGVIVEQVQARILAQ